MAVLDSYISTTNAANSIHLDSNGAHYGVQFSFTGYNYAISSIEVMLGYRLNQDGDADTHTYIQCYVRDFYRVGGVIVGSTNEGDNLVTAEPVSTSELTTYGYYSSPVGDWVTFDIGTNFEFVSGLPYAFVLVLDTPTVSNPSPPYNAVPIWGTRSTGSADFLYKTTAGAWQRWTTRRGIFRVNGSVYVPTPTVPDDLPTFPVTRPDDYDPDLIWTPPENPIPGNPPTWEEPGLPYQATGGGRWGQQLVVAGNDRVYYESLM